MVDTISGLAIGRISNGHTLRAESSSFKSRDDPSSFNGQEFATLSIQMTWQTRGSPDCKGFRQSRTRHKRSTEKLDFGLIISMDLYLATNSRLE